MVSPFRSARSSSSFVQYTVLSSERGIPASLKMQPRRRSQNGQHIAPRKATDTNIRGIDPLPEVVPRWLSRHAVLAARIVLTSFYTCFIFKVPGLFVLW